MVEAILYEFHQTSPRKKIIKITNLYNGYYRSAFLYCNEWSIK